MEASAETAAPARGSAASTDPNTLVVAASPDPLRVDLRGTGFTQVAGRTGELLRLSGPPGGPLAVVMEAFPAQGTAAAKLDDRLVFARANTVRRIGAVEAVAIDGREHEALAFTVGTPGPAMEQHCLVALRPHGGDAHATVLLTLITPAGEEPSCERAVAAPPMARLLRTLRFAP
jgi:hypothetical protein